MNDISLSCIWCGPHIIHCGVCPKVKSIEYHENGTIKRVEFHGEGKQQTAAPTHGKFISGVDPYPFDGRW